MRPKLTGSSVALLAIDFFRGQMSKSGETRQTFRHSLRQLYPWTLRCHVAVRGRFQFGGAVKCGLYFFASQAARSQDCVWSNIPREPVLSLVPIIQ
jgi:hypothetical protein